MVLSGTASSGASSIKLAIKLNNSSSIKLLSNTDRASPDSTACGAVQERRKAYFWEDANGPSACCDADISPASIILKMLTLQTALYF